MTTYGVVPEGFQRKPLAVILAEIEAQLITEFGPDVIQTSQSPLGQLNGVFADLTSELWEFAEDTYQSYDPDQAEGTRLDTLAKLRLLRRSSGESDEDFRQAITNADRGRNDIQDLSRAVRGLDGVTYTQVFVNDSNAVDDNGMSPGMIAVAVLGGDDDEIGLTMRNYITPGISTYGNVDISTTIDGFCRAMRVIRPILIPVKITIAVRVGKDTRGCPPPSFQAIKNTLLQDLAAALINGMDISLFLIRSLIESRYPNIVEVVSILGERDNISQSLNQPVDIGFIEMATVAAEDISIISA